MKLSERLGAVESEAAKSEPAKPAPPRRPPAPAPEKKTAPPRPEPVRQEAAPPAEKPARAKRSNVGWEVNKKRVRDLVLADLGPRLTGPKRLGSELEKEVKAALDRALQREDVRISPVERTKFVAEVLSDILG
ncbi:MAG TPA: hypothetical protein VJ456_03780, partial [Acidimicrobiia bacterium]|nr:hypothetical protein [Acidimicrobiia bacterium]